MLRKNISSWIICLSALLLTSASNKSTETGHDDHTFNNPDFIKLVKNGVMWAVGEKAQAALAGWKLPDVKYSDANIPNYERRTPAPKLQAPLSPQESILPNV